MQFYKYETHSHTSLVSECSTITPEILARYYKAHGYAGVFITDHFLNGSTTVPKELSWQDQIYKFCEGYDTHHDRQTILNGIQLKRRLSDEQDMIQALILGETEVFSQFI